VTMHSACRVARRMARDARPPTATGTAAAGAHRRHGPCNSTSLGKQLPGSKTLTAAEQEQLSAHLAVPRQVARVEDDGIHWELRSLSRLPHLWTQHRTTPGGQRGDSLQSKCSLPQRTPGPHAVATFEPPSVRACWSSAPLNTRSPMLAKCETGSRRSLRGLWSPIPTRNPISTCRARMVARRLPYHWIGTQPRQQSKRPLGTAWEDGVITKKYCKCRVEYGWA
jgi:hypothetical protein